MRRRGASAGIGLKLARQLADRGHDVVGVGSSSRIEDLGSRLPMGVAEYPAQADLRPREGIDQVWPEVESVLADSDRPLAVAALSAGKSLGGAFLDADIEDELEMISLNITSPLQGKDRVVGGTRTTKRNALVNKFRPESLMALRSPQDIRPS